MASSPFGNINNPAEQGFRPSTNASQARSYVRPIVLLIIIGVIVTLLFDGLLAFPGVFFWFIGGDLMQIWFIVLVVLGLLYRGSLVRMWRKRTPRSILAARYQAFNPEYPAGAWSAQTQEQSPGQFTRVLLHIPLALLAVFLVYYFFIVGYTFQVGPQLSITGDCNGGTITVQGKPGSDTISIKAGLLTIESFGNYDNTNHVLNLNGNLCGLTLEVPATTNVHLTGNDATLWIKGVTGKVELDNNAGDINVDGSTLLAGSTVTNNAGNISISNSCLTSGTKVDSNGSPITQTNVQPCKGTEGR